MDEFQDTSRLQRDLVSLLWARDEERKEGRVPTFQALRGHGLFVVGDRKQSIYGFRGADVGVFAELCVALAGEAARTGLGIPPGVTWEPEVPTADFVSLRHNRRGVPPLLAFANACREADRQTAHGRLALVNETAQFYFQNGCLTAMIKFAGAIYLGRELILDGFFPETALAAMRGRALAEIAEHRGFSVSGAKARSVVSDGRDVRIKHRMEPQLIG